MSSGEARLLDLAGWSLSRDTLDGPITLLKEIDLSLHRGQRLGVLGGNGSGKTSLLRYLAGEESPLQVPAAFICQDPDDMIVATTVRGELSLGRRGLDTESLLSDYGLASLAGLDPRVLSAGQKQRLTVAVALAGQPELLLCDEPTALQDRSQSLWLRERLRRWREQTGGAVIMATQSRDEAMMADHLVVLESGRIVAEGPPSDVLETQAGRALLDETVRPPRPEVLPQSGGEAIAVWENLELAFFTGEGLGGFSGLNLEVRPGDRIGLTGPNGCGKSSLLTVAAGIRASEGGSCVLGGRRLCQGGVPDLGHGLALLSPQFPEYFFTRATVAAEIELDPGLASVGVDGLLDAIGLSRACADRNPHALSSGERRRLAVAMVALSGRPLLLFDEPTAGQDLDGRRLLQRLLDGIPRDTAVIVASHDVAFLGSACHKILELTPEGLVPTGS